MNVGMYEAYDLAQRLSLSSEDQRQVAVASYSDDRSQEWSDLLCLEKALPGNAADPWILENKDILATNLPASGDTRRALLEQVHLDGAGS